MPLTFKCLAFLKYKMVKIFGAITLIGWSFAILIQAIYCLKSFNLDNWMEYSPMLFAPSFMLIQLEASIEVHLRFEEITHEYMSQVIFIWKMALPKAKSSICYNSKMGDWCFVIEGLIIISSTELIRQDLDSHLSDSIGLVHFVENRLPYFKMPIVWYVRITVPFLSIMLVIGPFYFIYISVLLETQFLVLTEYAYSFSNVQINSHLETSLKKGQISFEKTFFRENLLFLIKHYQKVMQFHLEAKKKLYLGCAMSGLAIVILVMFHLSSIFGKRFAASTVCYSLFSMISLIAVISYKLQLCENQPDILCDALYNLNWYHWNVADQKTLLIFLALVSRPAYFEIMPGLRFNHGYLRKVLEVIYTLGNLIKSLSDK